LTAIKTSYVIQHISRLLSCKIICLIQKVLSICGQDIVEKEEMAIEPHPGFEDTECGREMISLASNINTADNGYQNLNTDEMSTVVLGSSEGVPEQTQFAGCHRQLEHNVSEIQRQELRCGEEGSHQSVESIRSAEFMGTLVSNEDTAGEFVERTGNVTHRAKPQFSRKTDIMLTRPRFGTAKEHVNEMEKSSVIHVQLISAERVGCLKW
jgi:hypothetical protein